MGKKAKFTAALNAIKTKRFKLLFKYGIFIALYIVLYDALLIAQGVDFEENEKAEIALSLFRSAAETTLLALAYIVVGFIAVLFHMASLFGLNDPVIAISLILLCFALVVDLMLGAPSQQNGLPAQCDTFAYRFYLTSMAFAVSLGVVMKVKIKFDFRNR